MLIVQGRALIVHVGWGLPVLNGTACHFSPHAPPVTSAAARASGVTGYGTCASGCHQYKEVKNPKTQCQDEVRTYSAGTHILKVVKWG